MYFCESTKKNIFSMIFLNYNIGKFTQTVHKNIKFSVQIKHYY